MEGHAAAAYKLRMTLFRYDPRQARPTAPRGDHQTEALVAHVERHVAPVENVFIEIVSETVHLDVIVTAPTPATPFRLVLTSGLSDLPMRVPAGAEHLRYAELFVLLPPEWPVNEGAFSEERWFWPLRAIRGFARLPHEHGSFFAFGHTLGNGEPPGRYDESTLFAGGALLQAPNLSPAFHTVSIAGPNPKTIHLLAFVPLYGAEIALARTQGLDALTTRLGAAGVDAIVRVGRPDLVLDVRHVEHGTAGATSYAHVSVPPGGVSMADAQRLQDAAQGALSAGDRASAVNAAARLMMGGKYEEAIVAYRAIGEADASRRGLAAGQIGAACFFLGRYEEALTWYRNSAEWGEDPSMVRDNIEEAEAALRAHGRPIPPPPQHGASIPPTGAAPSGAVASGQLASLRDVIRNAAQSERGRRLHFAEDLPPKKATYAQEILRQHASSPVVAFFDLTLMGGGRDAVVLTEHALVARDGDERVELPLHGVASPLLVGMLEDRIQVTVNGAMMTFPCGDHGETLVRVLSSIAHVVHRR